MQPNKTKLALVLGALLMGASGASTADPFTLTVNTISDVSILEVTPLDFGTNVTTNANQECTMNADVPNDTDVLSDEGGTTMTGAGYGVLTGLNCVGTGVTVATPGVYSIFGAPGLTVNISFKSEVQAGDYTFLPAGCAVDNDGAATTTDTCELITSDGPSVAVKLADNDSTPAVDGYTHFTVGGELAVLGTPLASDLAQNVTFLVDVVY